MEKLSFALDIEDGWPPVAVEHVWCEKTGSVYELKNAPFFIKGLALGDRFTAVQDNENSLVFEFTVVELSGHSLAWVIDAEDVTLNQFKSELLGLGCKVEGLPAFNLNAIDVPTSTHAAAVSALMDKLEGLGFAMAFPVWRHAHNDV